MEQSQPELCTSCSKPLPSYGFFCGNCLTQFKCKSCEAILEKDYAGCVNCGTPKESKNNASSDSKNLNTFRLHETATDRTIEASFSDNVGKDLTEMLRDTYSIKMGAERINVKQLEKVNNSYTSTNNDDASGAKDNPISEKLTSANRPDVYPTLLALAMKNLPGSETEWVVVYSFYASNFGSDIFTQQNIVEKYEESKRKNPERMHVLTIYIKQAVKSGYINPLNEGFSILEKGVEKAKEIISRTTGSVSKTKSGSAKREKKTEGDSSNPQASTKKTSNPGKSLKRLTGIDFFPSNKESLQDFYGRFSPASDNDRNLLFVFYMEEILQIPAITFDHIYTCYDALDLRISENLPQTVRNTKSKTGWIETEDASNIKVTVKGRNQVKLWSKKE